MPRRRLFALVAAAGLAAVTAEAYVLSPTLRVGWVAALESAGADDRLAGMLRDRHPAVRRAAAGALARRGAAAVTALVRRADDPGDGARPEAVAVLGRIGPAAAAALPVLRRWARDDPAPGVRGLFAHAAFRVGRGDPDVLADLLDALEHAPTADERAAAAAALVPFGAPADRTVPALARLLAAGDEADRVRAAETLQEYGPAGRPAVPALVAALADPSRKVREEAAEALDGIAAGLGEADAPLRATVAAALAARRPAPPAD